jgi:hypothetical protein
VDTEWLKVHKVLTSDPRASECKRPNKMLNEDPEETKAISLACKSCQKFSKCTKSQTRVQRVPRVKQDGVSKSPKAQRVLQSQIKVNPKGSNEFHKQSKQKSRKEKRKWVEKDLYEASRVSASSFSTEGRKRLSREKKTTERQ